MRSEKTELSSFRRPMTAVRGELCRCPCTHAGRLIVLNRYEAGRRRGPAKVRRHHHHRARACPVARRKPRTHAFPARLYNKNIAAAVPVCGAGAQPSLSPLSSRFVLSSPSPDARFNDTIHPAGRRPAAVRAGESAGQQAGSTYVPDRGTGVHLLRRALARDLEAGPCLSS